MKQSVLIITFDPRKEETKKKVDEFITSVGSECNDVIFASSSIVDNLIKKVKEDI